MQLLLLLIFLFFHFRCTTLMTFSCSMQSYCDTSHWKALFSCNISSKSRVNLMNKHVLHVNENQITSKIDSIKGQKICIWACVLLIRYRFWPWLIWVKIDSHWSLRQLSLCVRLCKFACNWCAAVNNCRYRHDHDLSYVKILSDTRKHASTST